MSEDTFVRLSGAALVLDVRRDLVDAVRAAGLLASDGVERLRDGRVVAHGRSEVRALALPGTATLIVRWLRHGGLLGPLLGGRWLGLARPRRELAVTARLLAAGAPVPRAALCAGHRVLGPLFEAAVATELVPDACDGVAWLAAAPPPRRVRAACAAAGRAVRRFHDAGGRHADLHLKNLLVIERAGALHVLVIDLDRARHGPPPVPRARMGELQRLARSLHRRDLVQRLGRDGVAAFLAGYVGRDRALAAALRAGIPRAERHVRRHALFYRAAARS